jgi:hypothetical protein
MVHCKQVLTLALPALALALATTSLAAQERFTDDFEHDLSAWRLEGAQAIRLVDSGNERHGQVLELEPDGLVYAVIEGSETWGPVRIEADFLFPDDRNNYLGLVYNLRENGGRVDFGSLYIKGNGSYVRANPWRDGNASRLLYEEYKTPLTGSAAVEIGQWQHLRAEIDGNECHFYVGDSTTPQITFDLFEGTSGEVGFKARIVGFPVWLDNIRVESIDGLSYQGPPIPKIEYAPEGLLTEWEVHGPLTGPNLQLERAEPAAEALDWRPFPTDRRGAVISGRVTEYSGGRSVAYFRTTVSSDTNREAVIHISNTEELALFLNGQFWSFVYRDGYISPRNDWNAWFDFSSNPDHGGRRIPIQLQAGENEILLRSRTGQFAAGGFFARIEGKSDSP